MGLMKACTTSFRTVVTPARCVRQCSHAHRPQPVGQKSVHILSCTKDEVPQVSISMWTSLLSDVTTSTTTQGARVARGESGTCSWMLSDGTQRRVHGRFLSDVGKVRDCITHCVRINFVGCPPLSVPREHLEFPAVRSRALVGYSRTCK